MADKKENVGYNELMPIITEQLNSGGSVCIKPYGSSMLPLIRQGKDEVVLEKYEGKAKRYDILFYRRKNDQLVLHRVVKFDKNGGYIIRGDHQFEYEKGITDDDVIAIVKEIRRDGRSINRGSLEYLKWATWGAFTFRAMFYLRKIKKSIFQK